MSRSQHAQKDVQAGSGARLDNYDRTTTRESLMGWKTLRWAPSGKSAAIPMSDIFINDKTISAQHAKLSKVPNGYLLTATAAKNGVIVNGHSQTRLFLSHNDKIQLGPH